MGPTHWLLFVCLYVRTYIAAFGTTSEKAAFLDEVKGEMSVLLFAQNHHNEVRSTYNSNIFRKVL